LCLSMHLSFVRTYPVLITEQPKKPPRFKGIQANWDCWKFFVVFF
jgi:hypothetical protein